jgi:hypothetical protein
MQTRRRAALGGAVLAMATTASLALGEDPTPCYEAYRTSELTLEQMGFGEFRDRYADDVCAKGGRNDARDAREDEGFGRKGPP